MSFALNFIDAKPCPFCGGKPRLCTGLHGRTDAKVVCDDCDAEGPLFGADDYKTGTDYSVQAIAAWNHRA